MDQGGVPGNEGQDEKESTTDQDLRLDRMPPGSKAMVHHRVTIRPAVVYRSCDWP